MTVDRAVDDVLAVAREHGTMVAAAWSGWSRARVVRLRRELDGYTRGRGHPTKAEMAAMLPRLDGSCLWCAEVRSIEATKSNYRHAGTRGPESLAEPHPRTWREQSLCRGLDVSVWFPSTNLGYEPGVTQRGMYGEARSICAACPVATECLDYALANRIDHGVFGGLDPYDRAALTVAA